MRNETVKRQSGQGFALLNDDSRLLKGLSAWASEWDENYPHLTITAGRPKRTKRTSALRSTMAWLRGDAHVPLTVRREREARFWALYDRSH